MICLLFTAYRGWIFNFQSLYVLNSLILILSKALGFVQGPRDFVQNPGIWSNIWIFVKNPNILSLIQRLAPPPPLLFQWENSANKNGSCFTSSLLVVGSGEGSTTRGWDSSIKEARQLKIEKHSLENFSPINVNVIYAVWIVLTLF